LQKGLSNFLRIPLLFAVFVILGLTFGYLTFKVLSFSKTVEVPQLTNMTLIEANEALNKAGLYLKIEGEDYDPSVQAGRILRQDVPAGRTVKEKRAIAVIVSKGPRVYSVPSLVNETLSDAQAALLQKGLRVGNVIYVHSDSVEKGKIIAQRPEPDEPMTDSIIVLVSLGPNEVTYYCPNFLDKSYDDAKAVAGKMGLVLQTRGEGGIVVSQKPKAGAPIRSGDTISLELKEGAQ
jgi:eukaryotic-like serine/threonine-protein kinase